MMNIATVDKNVLTIKRAQTELEICASNRSTSAKAARLQPTSKALASVLLT
jgi:hypothetical protein